MNSNSSSKYSSVSQTSSIAPQDFKISGQSNDMITEGHEDSDNSSVIETLKRSTETKTLKETKVNDKKYWLECRVCRSERSIFFCSDCIRNGDFTYSKQRIPERFAEKKLKCFKLKTELMAINDKIESQLNNGFIKDEMEFRIRSLESNVEALKTSLTKAKQKLNLSNISLNKNESNQNECKERQTKLSSKIIEAKQFLIRRKNTIGELCESKDRFDSYIKDLVQQRVQQLTSFIFPIETKDTLNESNERTLTSSSESSPLLETISDSNNFSTNYMIVEPWINGNGDYSSFALYVSKDRDSLPNRDSNMRNPKHRMCAALAFITQMINIIAFYLDIRLPKRLSYSEFFANDLNESQFAHKVAKLNVNVIYLCISQDIETELLNPRQTAKNLLHLVHSSKCLGLRNHRIIVNTNFYESLENTFLSDLSLIDETELEDSPNDANDENLIVEYDWVEPSNLPDLQLNMSSQQTSITNLLSTFSSFLFGRK